MKIYPTHWFRFTIEIIHVLVIVSLDAVFDFPREFLIVDLNSKIDERG